MAKTHSTWRLHNAANGVLSRALESGDGAADEMSLGDGLFDEEVEAFSSCDDV